MKLLSGRILKPSHSSSFVDTLLSCQPDSPVSRLVLPEDETQLMIRDIYTHTSLKESPPVDQLTLFSKTSKESSAVKQPMENRYSNMSSETWKKEVISHRGEYSARLKLVRPINEKESLSWPTARNSDAEGGRIETEMSKKGFRSKRHTSDQYFGAKLRDAVETHEEKNWPTPTLAESSGGKRTKQIKEGKWHNIQLREAIDLEKEKNWPTPTSTQDAKAENRKTKEKSWPTPAQRDYKNVGTPESYSVRRESHCQPLPEVVINGQADQEKSSTSGKSQESPGKLNPNWVEQLMGLPLGWTQLPIEWID